MEPTTAAATTACRQNRPRRTAHPAHTVRTLSSIVIAKPGGRRQQTGHVLSPPPLAHPSPPGVPLRARALDSPLYSDLLPSFGRPQHSSIGFPDPHGQCSLSEPS